MLDEAHPLHPIIGVDGFPVTAGSGEQPQPVQATRGSRLRDRLRHHPTAHAVAVQAVGGIIAGLVVLVIALMLAGLLDPS